MPLFLDYTHLLLIRNFLKTKRSPSQKAGNQARSVESAILHSEAYSADTEISYQAASLSEHRTNVLTFQQEENQMEADSQTSAASKSLLN